MLKRFVVSVAVLLCGALLGVADTIQMKDAASVTGKILAEKPDQVVVDLGYTVLTIPRKEIVGISKLDELSRQGEPNPAGNDLNDSLPRRTKRTRTLFPSQNPTSVRS